MNKMNNADFVKKAIFLKKWEIEPEYGDETVDINGFSFISATVNICLSFTEELCEIVDAIREEKGFLPMLPTEKHKEDYDEDGYYSFYINFNDYSPTHIDNRIVAIVSSQSDDCLDDYEEYDIDIDESAQLLIRERINEQLVELLGTSIEEMLAEAREFIA